MLKNFLMLLLLISLAQGISFSQRSSPDEEVWVDSVLSGLSLEEKVGQLFMVAAYSNRNEEHYTYLENLIKTNKIGGMIFFQGSPEKQVELTNRFQILSDIPLLISMDLEWGLGMRLDNTINFPKQMTLGAIQGNELIYEMGAEIARQMKLIGVHVNFAPVVDVNSNPANPVIGYRSFGEIKEIVANKGIAYMKGLQENGVMATMKHFPGHGDTNSDSHYTLPVLNHSMERLDSLELFPFKKLIEAGIQSAMVAHINIPVFDAAVNKPTTLSKKVIRNLLIDEMGFNGLIFTDAMNMRGITDHYKVGDADVLALQAGNDAILFPQDVSTSIKEVVKAVRRKKITKKDLNEKVKKILAAKYRLKLRKFQKINPENLSAKINSPGAKLLKHQLYKKAITVVTNKNDYLPVRIIDTTNFASLSINHTGKSIFQSTLDKYALFQHFNIPTNEVTADSYDELLNKLKHFGTVVAGVHGMNNSRSKNYGLRDKDLELLRLINQQTNLIVSVFGNPYSLRNFEDFVHLICAYEEVNETQSLAAQFIFGGIGADGKLPVTASIKFPAGTGLKIQSIGRFRYSTPEEVGLDSHTLNKIDNIVAEAIDDQATPGAQILVARNGAVVFEKSYGHYTYNKVKPVDASTIYDLASITKVVATLQTVMFLEGRGLIDLDKKASYYLKELKGTNKENMILRDILTHQSGLWPYLPHWEQTVTEDGFDTAYYSHNLDEKYSIQVSPNLYSILSLEDSLWKWTVDSKLREKEYRKPYDYKYSDMGYYILKRLAEKLLNQPMEDFLEQNFYAPLGMGTTCFLPLCRYPINQIAPTEIDTMFRGTVIQGMVHDEGAALSGGIAGHAGLFSNATDLAKVMQMLLQKGYYGGTQYFRPETIANFIKKQYIPNRRAIGWDKPAEVFNGPTSDYASPLTFGHTGFTGTAAWADPEFDLVYLFLSNRVYPSRDNVNLLKNNIRPRIQELIYQSIFEYQKTN